MDPNERQLRPFTGWVRRHDRSANVGRKTELRPLHSGLGAPGCRRLAEPPEEAKPYHDTARAIKRIVSREVAR